jgi:hypothetical protein
VVSTTTGVEGPKGLEAKVAREPPEAETSSGVLAVQGGALLFGPLSGALLVVGDQPPTAEVLRVGRDLDLTRLRLLLPDQFDAIAIEEHHSLLGTDRKPPRLDEIAESLIGDFVEQSTLYVLPALCPDEDRLCFP